MWVGTIPATELGRERAPVVDSVLIPHNQRLTAGHQTPMVEIADIELIGVVLPCNCSPSTP